MNYAEIAWLCAALALLAYEAWAAITGHQLLSVWVWTFSHSQYGPLLPFLVGILCGHMFWSGQTK
jgi:hypothetical protein